MVKGGARPGVPHRANGTGSIKRVVRAGVASFVGRVTIDGEEHWAKSVRCRKLPDGKRMSEATARALAEKNLRALIADLEAGRRRDPAKERMTLAQYADLWRQQKADSLPADTPSWKTYELLLDKHVLPLLGRLRLRSIHPQDILDWRDALLDDPDEPRSVDRVRGAEGLLRMMLRDAIGYPVDPDLLKMRLLAPQKRAKLPHVTEAQFLLLLDAAAADPKGEPWRTMYAVAFFTGARCSEVCGLEWRSVLATSRQIAIAQQLDPRTRLTRDTKRGKTGTADVPVEVIGLLDTWRRAVESRLGRPVEPDELVFGRVAYDAARHALQRHARAAKLDGIGWHSLRRGFATANITSKTAPLILQQMMRHSDIRTTMEYLREVPGIGRGAAEKLAKRTLRKVGK